MNRDPRIDAYIAKAPAFAKPILEHLRAAVHAACADAEETMKWSRPHFTYKGKLFAGMSAFKLHVTFGFWRGSEVVGASDEAMSAMGQFGRITSLDDLPEPRALAELITKAMTLSEAGPPKRQPKHEPSPKFAMPEELATALAGNAAAAASFNGFPPSAQYDYVEWVAEAKRPETRAKRVSRAIEQLAEGRRLHWKYEIC